MREQEPAPPRGVVSPGHGPSVVGMPHPGAPYLAAQVGAQAGVGQHEIDALIEQQKLPVSVLTAAALMAVHGFILVLCTLQLWSALRFKGVWNVLPYVMLALGAISIYAAIKTYRGRPWAVILGLVVCAISMVATTLWFLAATGIGFFSLLGAVAPLLATCAIVFAALAIGPCNAIERARRRLAELGVAMDF